MRPHPRAREPRRAQRGAFAGAGGARMRAKERETQRRTLTIPSRGVGVKLTGGRKTYSDITESVKQINQRTPPTLHQLDTASLSVALARVALARVAPVADAAVAQFPSATVAVIAVVLLALCAVGADAATAPVAE